MAITKQNGDIIPFLKQKDYIMVNNNLGEGSFGKTVLLKDPFIDELFVAKKYEPEYDEIKEQFYKNFLDEIKIMYKLNHKNIVRIYNYYAYEDSFLGYILMEYIDGKNIGTFLNEYLEPFESVSLDEIFIQLIDAFCCMEEHGIVHRDIREGNILVDNNGTVKVIDFGIGKIFSKPEEAVDSLVLDINRDGSGTLPQEYYEGIYTSLTDMFYLAELLQRLIKNSETCDENSFSYWDILSKMMEKRAENRYPSFAAIREAIGKRDFVNLEISNKDKKIYQEFTNLVCSALSIYTEPPRFVVDTAIFAAKLNIALELNLFESSVQNNADIINCVVSSNYKYLPRVDIPVAVVKSFFDWYQTSTHQSQALILNNFISKLSIIKVEVQDPDLPF